MADLQPILEVKREEWIAIVSQVPTDKSARFLTIVGSDAGLCLCLEEPDLQRFLETALSDTRDAFNDVATRNRIHMESASHSFRPGFARVRINQVYVDIPTALLEETMAALQAAGGAR